MGKNSFLGSVNVIPLFRSQRQSPSTKGHAGEGNQWIYWAYLPNLGEGLRQEHDWPHSSCPGKPSSWIMWFPHSCTDGHLPTITLGLCTPAPSPHTRGHMWLGQNCPQMNRSRCYISGEGPGFPKLSFFKGIAAVNKPTPDGLLHELIRMLAVLLQALYSTTLYSWRVLFLFYALYYWWICFVLQWVRYPVQSCIRTSRSRWTLHTQMITGQNTSFSTTLTPSSEVLLICGSQTYVTWNTTLGEVKSPF